MIEYITYKEKRYPVRISYIALNGFKADTGKDLESLASAIGDTSYESLLFHSLRAGAKATEEEMLFTKENMEDVLDECMFEFIGLIPKFFPDNAAGSTVKKQQPNRKQRRIQVKK